MAGTTDNYRTDKIVLGRGRIYGAVAVPAGAARLSIDATTLTPNSTSGAVHLGGTKAGAEFMVTTKWTEQYIDEFPDPIVTNVEQTEMSLKGELVGILDMSLLERLTPGTGTAGTGTGYEQLTFGQRAVVYQGFCIVAPDVNAPGYVVVAHIYKGLNSEGFKANFARKEMSFTPFNIKAYAITTRTLTDTLGNFWKTVDPGV